MRDVFTGECTVRSVGPDHSRRCHKQYVDVELRATMDGEIVPFAVLWPDGRRFEIDEIVSVGEVGPLLLEARNQPYELRFGGWITTMYLERATRPDGAPIMHWWVWAFDSMEVKNPVG